MTVSDRARALALSKSIGWEQAILARTSLTAQAATRKKTPLLRARVCRAWKDGE
jgi:hypothetical protein